ncbi:TPA: hypothetical protein ACIFEI_002721, partial [Acinetobacter nosocomialis]
MAGILTPEDFKKVRQDILDTGKAANEDVIVKPRYGLPFKSLPMLSRLFEEMLASGYVTIDDLQEAIDIALAGGAGAAGWTTDLVADGSETQKLINDKTTQNVPNIESLKALIVRKNGQRVLVNNRYVYEYKSQAEDTTDDIYSILPSNNVGRWILQKPVNLFASDFVKTKDVSEVESQSLKLQKVNDIAVNFGVPFVIDAEFMLAPVETDHNICFYVRSNNDITFTPRGNFKIIPNDFTTYSILHIENIENYKVLFPQVTGDRDQHLGTDGEWGYGIANYQSKKGYIYRPKVMNTWGDGIYVG